MLHAPAAEAVKNSPTPSVAAPPPARLSHPRAPAPRRCACGGIIGPDGECAACRARRLARSARPGAAAPAMAPPSVGHVPAGRGHALDPGTRAFMETRFGHDFGGVQLHTDTRAADSAAAVGAYAYTVGNHIVFGAGRYAPSTESGRHLLAHELAHVVQHAGRPEPAAGEPLLVGQPHDRFEQDASTAADRAIAGDPVSVTQRAAMPMLHGAWVSCGTAEECPAREPGEQARARSATLLTGTLVDPEPGFIIARFPIGSSNASGLAGDPTFSAMAASIAAGSDQYEILGFSDCEGGTERNTTLRAARAQRVLNAMPAAARSKITNTAGAPLADCVATNDTEENRAYNRSVVIRRTVISFEGETVTGQRPDFVCGPDVTQQVEDAANGLRSTFAGWTSSEKEDACDALDSLRHGAYAWDIVELHNNAWILNYRPICATQGATPPCGSSVQIGNQCYYAGSPNYVIFGVMCKLCYNYYYSIMLVNTGFARFTEKAMLDLIDLYKGSGFTGLATPSANYLSSRAWARVGYAGWPNVARVPVGDRSNCTPMCPTPYRGSAFRVNWYPNQFYTGSGR